MSDPTIPNDVPEPDVPAPEAPPAPDASPDAEVTGLAPQEAQPPGAEVVLLPDPGAGPRASNGEDAIVVIKHDSGANFFHNLGTIPKRFLNEVGDVVLGRHLNVTAEEAEKREPEPGPGENAGQVLPDGTTQT